MAKKTVTASINLPIESLISIIDIDNKDVDVKITKAFDVFKNASENDETNIRSMNTVASIPVEYENQRYTPIDQISLNHDIVVINSIKRRPIEKTNDLKFYKIKIEFSNGNIREFVIPSFVKFYSSHTGTFTPVERIRSRCILMDYAGNSVKVDDAEQVDFKMTDYYNIKVTYEIDEETNNRERFSQCNCNFYINGVLANVSYNNFQIKDVSEE